MAKSMMGLWSRFLLTILLIVAANRADAPGATVTVNFSGTASGPSTGAFSGTFSYDQSLVSPSPTFNFTLPFTHAMECTVPTGKIRGNGLSCEPFTITITTSNNTFNLVSTVSGSRGSPSTTVTIVVPNVATPDSSLPDCSFFPSSPTDSTFTLSGGFTFKGTITAIRCSTVTFAPAPPAPPPSPPPYPPPSPPLCPPPSPPPCPPPSLPPCYVYTYPAPAPCPAYACPSRPACCLTRLFARRSHCNSCW